MYLLIKLSTVKFYTKKSNVQLKIWRMFKNVNEEKLKRTDVTPI